MCTFFAHRVAAHNSKSFFGLVDDAQSRVSTAAVGRRRRRQQQGLVHYSPHYHRVPVYRHNSWSPMNLPPQLDTASWMAFRWGSVRTATQASITDPLLWRKKNWKCDMSPWAWKVFTKMKGVYIIVLTDLLCKFRGRSVSEGISLYFAADFQQKKIFLHLGQMLLSESNHCASVCLTVGA